jgi:hypothetical protein
MLSAIQALDGSLWDVTPALDEEHQCENLEQMIDSREDGLSS